MDNQLFLCYGKMQKREEKNTGRFKKKMYKKKVCKYPQLTPTGLPTKILF
jgi:hypothetical protein